VEDHFVIKHEVRRKLLAGQKRRSYLKSRAAPGAYEGMVKGAVSTRSGSISSPCGPHGSTPLMTKFVYTIPSAIGNGNRKETKTKHGGNI
ncbi:hypothetical protein ACB288_20865, partial [Aeromonas taiwanensis]